MNKIEIMVRMSKGEKGGYLYLMRHAQTPENAGVGAKKSKDTIRGWMDDPLDDEGIEQAEEIAEWFEDKDICEIYCSDFQRTTETAQILGSELGLKVQPSYNFRPWNLGVLQELPENKFEPLMASFVENPDMKIKDGESFQTFLDRYIPSLKELMKKVEEGKNIILVGHYRSLKSAQAWFENGMGGCKVDVDVMLTDDIPIGSIMEFCWHPGDWSYRKLKYIGGEEMFEVEDAMKDARPKMMANAMKRGDYGKDESWS